MLHKQSEWEVIRSEFRITKKKDSLKNVGVVCYCEGLVVGVCCVRLGGGKLC